ncbi:MAG: hypothetical protein NZO16_08080 [Deltaproteobacteria bacterium]|nr:hypothetical protein [Deltaproteobacteria bacterium]
MLGKYFKFLGIFFLGASFCEQCALSTLENYRTQLNDLAVKIYTVTDKCKNRVPRREALRYSQVRATLKRSWLDPCGLVCPAYLDPVNALKVKRSRRSLNYWCEVVRSPNSCEALGSAMGVVSKGSN